MKLLLHADIPKLGYFGDVVDVADGYARNYLIPQRLAVTPTESNIKAIEQERAQKAEERRLKRERLTKIAEKVEGIEITITALSNEIGHLFGSINEDMIAETLREAGHEIQSRQVRLREHIRMLGSHKVNLTFAEDLQATITVNVTRPEGEGDEPQSESETESQAEPEADAAEQG